MHPITALDAVDLEIFESERTAQAWFSKRANSFRWMGLLKEQRRGPGRYLYCNWPVKNPRHEHELTKACLLFYGDCMQSRGPYVDKRLADAEWVFPHYSCYVEMFCGTQWREQWNKRKRAYKNTTKDIRIIVSAVDGKDDECLERLKGWSEDIYDRAYFTTLKRLIDDPNGYVWDHFDGEWLENSLAPEPELAQVGTQETEAE